MFTVSSHIVSCMMKLSDKSTVENHTKKGMMLVQMERYDLDTHQLIAEIRHLIQIFQDEHAEEDKREVFLAINDLTIELVRRESHEELYEHQH
ncbi:hypothetical protein [Aureibacillus halotolerans]|uniref:Uncharacterized protein n=1 Tax=Aureibacillus halotolerans TaxID=1508390 RepID=A0A4R6TSR5_9BACI|nr:hypothetical protein [Aureibacillus halotolerans]TDQ36106.1 hypothetical protein EV213_12037 [Aureibacillus halotolerans]